MKHIRQSKQQGSLSFDALAKKLNQVLLTKGIGINPLAGRASYGLESLSPEHAPEAEAALGDAERELEKQVGEEIWNEELTEGQQDAGVILMNASNDPAAYHAAATAEVSSSDALLDANTVDTANISTESYDAREIEKTMSLSIAFNVGAARQQPAMELFWPTISLTADQAGLTLEVSRNMVHGHFVHDSKGLPAADQFGQKSLIDALIDSSILQNQATDIVPVYDAKIGIYDNELGAFPVKVDNVEVQSGAFLFGAPLNIIAADNSSLTDPFGQRDQTDTVDSLVRLQKVFLEITDSNDVKSIVPFDVRGLPLTGFNKSIEGHERQASLAWTTNSLPLHGKLLDKTGVEAEALKQLRAAPYDNHVFMLKVSANGSINLADGNCELTAGSATVYEVYKSVQGRNGTPELELVTDPTEVTAAKALIKSITLRSYTLDARYANLNRRERGLIVRTDTRRQKYMIPLQAPITAMKPVTDTETGYNIDAAVQAARVANTTAGIHELMAFDDFMHRYRTSQDRHRPAADIECVGKFILRPYYERKTFDFTKVINNVHSHTLADDIAAALTLNLRDSFSKAMLISGWNAAQECAAGGAKEKPTAIIVCDPRVAQFLTIKGDSRLFGDFYKTAVEVSDYYEFRNRIFMSVRREASVQNPDGLSFGNMFWLPELITNLPIARSGQISNEFTVQTRRRHIAHCPILVRYDLVNLDKVVDTKVAVSVVQ